MLLLSMKKKRKKGKEKINKKIKRIIKDKLKEGHENGGSGKKSLEQRFSLQDLIKILNTSS